VAVLRQLGAVEIATGNSNVATNILLFTAGGAEQIIVGAVVYCNLDAVAKTIRLAHVPSADSIANKHHSMFDVPLAANETKAYQVPISMAASDKIYVRASITGVAVTAAGVVNP
jgi:hypothetical protein